MSKTLQQFTLNEAMREEVHSYILSQLENDALKAIFEGGDTSGYKEAKASLKRAFQKLKTDYKPMDHEDKKVTMNPSM